VLFFLVRDSSEKPIVLLKLYESDEDSAAMFRRWNASGGIPVKKMAVEKTILDSHFFSYYDL
jgi:hypothetical protein